MDQQDLEYLDYIETSTKALQSLEEEKNELQTKLAELKEEKVILEKVASQPTFDKEKLDKALSVLAENRMLDPDYKEKVASIVEENPERILDLITKIANSSAAYESGRSISKTEPDIGSDLDGWSELKSNL
jgi:chromosome segregation ATPase